MTTQHTDEMREAFEQLWSDRYQNEETFFDQFSSPQIMKDFAKLFAYEMYQAATASAEARYLGVIEVLKEVDKVCVMSLLDQDALQHNMKLILPRIREALAAPLLGGK